MCNPGKGEKRREGEGRSEEMSEGRGRKGKEREVGREKVFKVFSRTVKF